MSELDIRLKQSEAVTSIRFQDDGKDYDIATHLTVKPNYDNYVGIVDNGNEFVLIRSAQHAVYLIQALEKAVELGWLK